MIRALIIRLLNSGLPLAIRQFIIVVVIYTSKRMPKRWTKAHITDKVFKLMPFFADFYRFDFSTSIIFKPCVNWVITPGEHTIPDIIFGGFGELVSRGPFADQFTHQAPTGFCMLSRQIAGRDDFDSAALASNFPDQSFAVARNSSTGQSYYSKSPKNFSKKIFSRRV